MPQRRADEADVLCQDELDRARRTNRRLRRFSLLFAAMAAVAILAVAWTIRQSTLAQARQLAANAQLALNQGNTHLAVLLALEAQKLAPAVSEQLLGQTIPTRARHASGHLLNGDNRQIMGLAWHPDGSRLAFRDIGGCGFDCTRSHLST